jgi:hypothetical protein
MDLHICLLCFGLHPLCFRRWHNFEFVLSHCCVQMLLLVTIEFILQHKFVITMGGRTSCLITLIKKTNPVLNDGLTFQFLLPLLLLFL